MPPTARRHPRSTPRIDRPYLAGYIGWLPPKDADEPDSGHDDGFYGHPIVILSPLAQDGRLTSFGGNDLASKYTSTHARGRYLPISPSPAHPDNGKLLYLDVSSLPLRRSSNINTENKREMELSSFRPYDSNSGNVCLLSRNSYQELIEYARFEVPLADLHQHDLLSSIMSNGAQISPSQANSTRYQPIPRISNHGGAPTRHQTHHGAGGRTTGRGQSQRAERFTRPASRPHGNYGTISSSSRSQQPVVRTPNATQSDSGSSGSIGTVLEMFLWCALAIVLGYGAYRAGCWTVWAAGAAIDAIKDAWGAATGAIRQTINGTIATVKNVPSTASTESGYWTFCENLIMCASPTSNF
ncbi:hypothetical protein PFICI_00683 [Pestalotiopsis fici W106-1]|uniref:Uncharacterized protein n=1 Tax=Pestalotiopsis fici (strain W106-1 / CGMCC3.15140) TaxID=1229662 RepID=W3XLK3_PESFW|nr:uncharacterized protein PFICI_00683 [Pestalotiopsis fici W106-1]ETS86855.1 hypothetical protein PFICI_00683 [Pestalotiopsis fici W106-1]